MKVAKKLLVTILILALCVPMLFLFTACNNKKAIIILPGLGGSTFIDKETKQNVYPPVNDYENVSFQGLLSGDIPPELVADMVKFISTNGAISKFFNDLSLNDDGTPLNPNIVSVGTGEYVTKLNKYGPFNFYKSLYQSLEAEFADKYEITVFQYDWRLSTANSALDLQNFIDEKGYGEVIFISHSLGGLLANDYLALSEQNRKKVKLNISYATPYLGAAEAFNIFDNPSHFMNILLGDMKIPNIDLPSLLLDFEDDMSKLICHLDCAHMMVPSVSILNTDAYKGKYLVKNNGVGATTTEEIKNILKSRSWAQNDDGSTIGVINRTVPQYDRLFKDYGTGTATHPALLVNSYFFYSVSETPNTTFSVVFSEDNISLDLGYSKTNEEKTSATLGLPDTDSRVYLVPNETHMSIVANSNATAKCIELINGL